MINEVQLNKLAAWLASKGAARNRLAWRLVYAVSPLLAGMVSTFAEALEPENQLVWWYDPAGDASAIDGVLGEVSDMINRAPTPFGLDGYHVFFTSLGTIPGDEQLTGEKADATLNRRLAKSVHLVAGNRWHDWKRGDGAQAVRTILDRFRPCSDAPVTLIQVAVTGSGVLHSLRAFGAL